MSNTYFLLVLSLLCLTLISTACKARHIDVTKKEPAKDFLLCKENEKSSLVRVSSSPPKKPEAAAYNNGNSVTENAVSEDKNNQSTRARKTLSKHQLKGQRPRVSADADQNESLETASWKLPHKKRGEQRPGFNLDYLPPMTHPPAHN